MRRWFGSFEGSRFADLFRSAARVLGRPLVRIGAVVSLAGAFLVLLTLQEFELRRERSNYNYLLTTNNWALSQLELELERFLGALDRYMGGIEETPVEQLSTRFDILWSRVPILLQGPETAEVRKIVGAPELLQDFAAALALVEPDLAGLVPDDVERYRRIRSTLEAFRQSIHELTMEVYTGDYFRDLAGRTRDSHWWSTFYQLSMLTVVGVLAALLGLEVLHGMRRARAEAAARRAAEDASLAKSTFLAAMSHELRTPLNAIMGFSEVQSREVFGPLPPRYRSYARDIHASADHLLAVLNDILDMARMDSRQMSLSEEDFDPSAAIYASIRMIDTSRESAALRLTVDIRTAGVLLRADPRLFRQIVLNLLSNAIKFTPAGGTVSVGLHRDGRGLILSVRDTGIGISRDMLTRVTEPFFQADQSHARRHQGTGLGLSLVRGFAEMHGGSMAIDSDVGRGTLVEVVFPSARILVAELPVPGLSGAAGGE